MHIPIIYFQQYITEGFKVKKYKIEPKSKIILIYFSYSLLQAVRWIVTVTKTFVLDLILIRCWKLQDSAREIMSSPLHIINIIFIIIVV
jgi:hypothetical protein